MPYAISKKPNFETSKIHQHASTHVRDAYVTNSMWMYQLLMPPLNTFTQYQKTLSCIQSFKFVRALLLLLGCYQKEGSVTKSER